MENGNREYKDNVFRTLFKEKKNFAELYFDITGKVINCDEIEFYDTTSLFSNQQLKNDISFITNDNRFIIMVEHQSTLSENLPLRCLLYYAEILKTYLKDNNISLHKRRAISIPAAELYVVYNGDSILTKTIMDLTVNSKHDNFVKVNVNLIDIRYANLPAKIKERNDILDGYSFLMDRINYYTKKKNMTIVEAFSIGKKECFENNLLVDYLNRKEFVDMILESLSIDDQIKVEREEGLEEGLEKGLEKGKIEACLSLIKEADMSLSYAMKILKLDDSYKDEIITDLEKQGIKYKLS